MKQVFASLEEWLAALREERVPIVVEGPSDRAALEAFGITTITTLSRTPLYTVVEDIGRISKRVIILTDLDKEGKRLYSRLKQSFDRAGVQVDTLYREWLFKETRLSHIEGLINYVGHEEMKGKWGNRTISSA